MEVTVPSHRTRLQSPPSLPRGPAVSAQSRVLGNEENPDLGRVPQGKLLPLIRLVRSLVVMMMVPLLLRALLS